MTRRQAPSKYKIEDIAADKNNRKILRKLKENVPEFTELYVGNEDSRNYYRFRYDYYYLPESASELGWLGYYIGMNTYLKQLTFYSNLFGGFSNNAIESFFRGVNHNRSIKEISFGGMKYYLDLSGGEIF